jgi:hypothetical protein
MGNGVRFKHTVNTQGGSSGAPCFNSAYEVVGLHQAGPEEAPEGVPNRAVPVHRFRQKIIDKLAEPLPEVKPILALAGGKTVIGRAATQQWIWRAIPKAADAPGSSSSKILVVKGAEGTGKKFTVDILRTVLTDGPHIVADLDAGNMIEDTPLTFAGKVLVSLTANDKRLPPNQGLTTDLNWLKLTLMPAIRKEIDEVRAERTVWIVFRYPADGVLPERSKIRDALDALYAQVGQVDWLRLVLLGLQVDVPEEVSAVTTTESLKLVGGAEVATYFQRRWTELGVPADPALLETLADDIVAEVRGDSETPPANYHERLVTRVVKLERALAKRLKKPR